MLGMKTKRNFEEKPYNRCLWCDKRRSVPRECNGPRTGSLETERWRELMRDIKEVDDLTYEEIAARTKGKMSAQSIQNALAPGYTGDLTREKARIIENAIMGDSIAPPCPFDFMNDSSHNAKCLADAEDKIAKLEAELERKNRIIDKFLDK